MQKLSIEYFSEQEFLEFLSGLTLTELAVLKQGIEVLLQSWAEGIYDQRFFKLLPQGLWQLRLGPTARNLLPGHESARVLLRVYFRCLAPNGVQILCAYNKLIDLRRVRQKEVMSIAYARMGIDF